MGAFSGCVRFGRFAPPRAVLLFALLVWLSIGIGNAQPIPSSQPDAHVYLLRGAFNVFSLGMDQIAAKLRQHGIHASVDNYLV